MKKTIAAAVLYTTALSTPSLAGTLPDNPLWTKTVASPGADVASMVCTDSLGNTIVGGHRTAANAAFVAKYDTNGHLLWNKNAPATETPSSCVTDPSGNIYTVDPTYIKRSNSAGTLTWRSQAVPGPATSRMQYQHIAAPVAGALWVSGLYRKSRHRYEGRHGQWRASFDPLRYSIRSGSRHSGYRDQQVGRPIHREWRIRLMSEPMAAWPTVCSPWGIFVFKFVASGQPVARVCLDYYLFPNYLASTVEGDPVIAGTGYAGHMGSSRKKNRELNYLSLATSWESDVSISCRNIRYCLS